MQSAQNQMNSRENGQNAKQLWRRARIPQQLCGGAPCYTLKVLDLLPGCSQVGNMSKPGLHAKDRELSVRVELLLGGVTSPPAASIWSRSINEQHFGNELEELWAEF